MVIKARLDKSEPSGDISRIYRVMAAFQGRLME